MFELKNSKIKYLGRADGRDRYSLDAFLGAVQMREPGGQWQDIKPRLVRDAGGWHVEGAPYYAEIKDDGARLFCPDKNERGRYLKIPAPALFSGLSRNVFSNPDRLDGDILPNQVTMPAAWGEIRIIFSNTGMHFEVLFREAPPLGLFGKDSPRILLDTETMGYDIVRLFESTSGIGIPKPRLISGGSQAMAEEPPERWLAWAYKNGQMELGFDFGDLSFPILLKNTTVDVQVDAGANDGRRYTGTNGFSATGTDGYIGYSTSASNLAMHHFYRFTGVTISGTIDTAYIQVARRSSGAGSPQMKIWGVDEDNPAAPTNAAEFDADPLTSAGVDWDYLFPSAGWHQSPSIVGVIQELVNSYTINDEAVMLQLRDDAGTGDNYNYICFMEYGSGAGVKLHVEYTAGGATEKTAAETGSGADGSALAAAILKAETGGGVDTRQSISASLAKAETGSGADTILSLLAGLAKDDSGVSSEQGLLSLLMSSEDVGGGLEALVSLIAGLMKTESGSGVESISGRGLVLDESGNGADILAPLLAAIAKGETGSGVEQSTLSSFVAKFAAEAGHGNDISGLIAGLLAMESGSGVDAGWLVGLKIILANDLGAGYETLKALIETSKAGSDMKLPGRAGQVRIPSKGVSL